jgi:flagellar basal body-associated protein FliL
LTGETLTRRAYRAVSEQRNPGKGVTRVSVLWIILIVVLVLLLLGFFSRGRW